MDSLATSPHVWDIKVNSSKTEEFFIDNSAKYDCVIKNLTVNDTITSITDQPRTYYDKSLVNFQFLQMEDWRDRALEELNNVFNECSEENWDGYMAAPVSKCVYSNVKKLLAMIPSSFPEPDILPEPDGSIGLEWFKKKNFVFVISIADNNIISYAGLFGKNNKIHGTECFYDSLPKIITDCLMRLFQNDYE